MEASLLAMLSKIKRDTVLFIIKNPGASEQIYLNTKVLVPYYKLAYDAFDRNWFGQVLIGKKNL